VKGIFPRIPPTTYAELPSPEFALSCESNLSPQAGRGQASGLAPINPTPTIRHPSISERRLSLNRHEDRPGVTIYSAEDVGRVSPFRSLCGAQARAVGLDDLTRRTPIMEHAVRLTPDRSAGHAAADCGREPQLAATIVTRMGGDAQQTAPVAGLCARLERDRPKELAAQTSFLSLPNSRLPGTEAEVPEAP
jgi:hypothetical protein